MRVHPAATRHPRPAHALPTVTRVLAGVLFEKLLDGRNGTSYTFLADGGINYKLPFATRLALNQGHYATQHPTGVRMIPEFFLPRLRLQQAQQFYGMGSPMQAAPSSAGGRGTTGAASFHLVLGSWEYFLYCFLLWPHSDRGACPHPRTHATDLRRARAPAREHRHAVACARCVGDLTPSLCGRRSGP